MGVATRRGAPPRTLNVEVAPAFEFLATLAVHSQLPDRETYEVGPTWFEEVERAAGKRLADRALRFSTGSDAPWLYLLPLAYEGRPPRDVASFIDHVRRLDDRELALHLVGYYQRHVRRETDPDVIAAAVDGDQAARRTFLTTSFPEWAPWRAYLERILGQDAGKLHDELVGILDGWAASVWPQQEARLLPILERDAESKLSLLGTMPMERFIEVATNGIDYVPRPEVRRVVLIPSYVSRPWVSDVDHHDIKIFLYPVADESVVAETDAPPLRLIRVSKALADEKRLRILRALAAGEMTLMELAEHFGLPKTTMHHHLIQLRSAGLVSVEAGTKRYRLRHDALPDVAALLAGYVGAVVGTTSDGSRVGDGEASGQPPATAAGRPAEGRALADRSPSRRRRPS